MSRFTSTRAAAIVSAATLAVTLGACGGSDQPEPEPVATHQPVVVTPVAATVEPTPTVDPNVSYVEAESTFKARRYSDATEMFTAYTTRRPENPWGHYMLGLSAWKSGELERSRAAFEAAINLDSTHVKSFVNLGRVLLDEGRPQDALGRVRQAIALDSANGDAWRVLGRAHGELGNVEESVSAYRVALTVDPNDTWSMNNMGLVLIRAGRYEEALYPLGRAVQLDEHGVAVFRNNLGIALERTGRFADAERLYRETLERDSTYEKAKTSLARVEGRTNAGGVPSVEISALGDTFARTVAEWRSARPAETVAQQSHGVVEQVEVAPQPSDSTP